MRVTILDVITNETKDLEQDWPVWWWEDGNGSCDCNRAIFFGHSEPGTHRYCAGAERYVIVDVHGDLEGETTEDILARLNSDYCALVVREARRHYRQHKERPA